MFESLDGVVILASNFQVHGAGILMSRFERPSCKCLGLSQLDGLGNRITQRLAHASRQFRDHHQNILLLRARFTADEDFPSKGINRSDLNLVSIALFAYRPRHHIVDAFARRD